MYKKVIVLELKQEYALAMEEGGAVLRIRRKKAMQVGDQLYVLPEDLYTAKENGKILPFVSRKQDETHGMGWPRRLAAMAAVLALIITVMLPKLTTPARAAVVSFDARGEVQVELDANNKVLCATSVDGSIHQDDLNELRGKALSDLGENLQALLGNGPVVMAYAPVTDGAAVDLEELLRQLFANQAAICLSGSEADVNDAEEQSVSLGRYLMGLRLTEDQLERMEDLLDTWEDQDLPEDQDDLVEDALEELDLSGLLALSEQDPSWLSHPDFQEALCEELENTMEDAEDQLEFEDHDPDDALDDVDDDSQDDEEDQEDQEDDND